MNQPLGRAAALGHMSLAPRVEIVSDPRAILERTADYIENGGPQPTAWMQRLRGRSGISTTPIGGTPEYEGRTCCYEHLRKLEGRTDLRLPFETTCDGCARVFRVTLAPIGAPRR